MKTALLAAKYANKAVLKKVWGKLKEHYYQSLLAKAVYQSNFSSKLNSLQKDLLISARNMNPS